MSTALTPEYAGKWSRAEGTLIIRLLSILQPRQKPVPAGTIISSPRGWYDAGDYNKYIVNSGITMGTLLSLYEDFRHS